VLLLMPEIQSQEEAALDIIRVETALSRYPIHRLAKSGTPEIQVHDKTGRVCWEVSYNSKYGQPGPLAYKIDTLVINRKIEEAGRPVPPFIRLGSLREIAEATGTGSSHTNAIKKALYQNVGALITQTEIRYKTNTKAQRSAEVGGHRYAIVFTGETLPDGRKADAVYIVFHPFYRQILDAAEVRPLDYDLLKKLTPVPQRLYELLSYQVYAALANRRPTARFSYAYFCEYAPQARHESRDKARWQMSKLHRPLLDANYITDVKLEVADDHMGKPDWTLIYTPGPKAFADHETFKAGRRGSAMIEGSPELTGLAAELYARGVDPKVAVELAAAHPPEVITAKVEEHDWLVRKKKVDRNPGGHLAKSIRDGFVPPSGFVPADARRALEQQCQDRHRQAVEASRAVALEQALHVRAQEALGAMSEDQRAETLRLALAAATPADRKAYEAMPEISRGMSRATICLEFLKAGLAAGATA
jgi:hypothetical protein